jgi:UDP-N-acetylglucosamine:LPS N-acetylglucosamine transferase
MKVLAISSAGGHWVQLRRLRKAFEGLDVAYASVYAANGDDVTGHRYHTFSNISRFNKLKLLTVASEMFQILRKERPDVVITTGAFPALICLVMAKYLFGAHTIWVDSIANCEELSTSGRHAGRIADVWLTQWEHLAGPNQPAYLGAVL